MTWNAASKKSTHVVTCGVQTAIIMSKPRMYLRVQQASLPRFDNRGSFFPCMHRWHSRLFVTTCSKTWYMMKPLTSNLFPRLHPSCLRVNFQKYASLPAHPNLDRKDMNDHARCCLATQSLLQCVPHPLYVASKSILIMHDLPRASLRISQILQHPGKPHPACKRR